MASRNSRTAIVVFTALGSASLANAADKVRVSVTNFTTSYLAAGVAAKKRHLQRGSLGRRNHPHERQRGGVRFHLATVQPDGAISEDGMGLVIDNAKSASKLNRPAAIAEVADASALRNPQCMLGIMAH